VAPVRRQRLSLPHAQRATRYVLLLHLSDGRDSAQVDAAMRSAITRLPRELVRTITWDQGKEMHRHAAFSVDTDIQLYFCDPHSPWQQRGSNENTNGPVVLGADRDNVGEGVPF
jgi:transposase, IS30 family